MYYDSTTIIKFRSNDGKFDRLCVVYGAIGSSLVRDIQNDFIKGMEDNPSMHYCDIINIVMDKHGYDYELPKVKTIHF